MGLKSFHIFLIVLVAPLVLLLLLPYDIYLVFIPIIFLLGFLYGKEFILFLIIFTFLIFTRSEFQNVRDVINIFLIILLVYLFFKYYGLNLIDFPKLPKEVYYFIFLLSATLLISTSLSASKSVSFFATIRTAVFFLVCYIFYSFIQDRKTVFLYLICLLVTEIFIGFSMYYDFINEGYQSFLISGIWTRLSGVSGGVNFASLTAIISLCITISFFFINKFSSRKYRFFLVLSLLNCMGILLMTDSRAAIIAGIISATFVVFMLNKKLLLKAYILLGIIFLILLSTPSIQDPLLLLLRPNEFGIREFIWDSGLEVCKDNIIFGVGPEMYPRYAFTHLASSAFFHLKSSGALSIDKTFSPHNYFILFTAENGILGLFASISIFILFFYLAFKCIKAYKSIDYDLYVISISAFGIGIAILFRAFFEVSGIMFYGFISQDLPFWLIFIILIYMYIRTKKLNQKEIQN